jgi:hypothetical protein
VTESVKQKTLMKASLLLHFLFSTYPFQNKVSIYVGSSSDELFPDISLLSKSFGSGDTTNFTYPFVNEMFPWQRYPLIFSMAPMRDMLKAWKTSKNVFNNTTVVAYGSFNIRSIASDKETELFINTAFKNIFIFEIANSLKEYGSWNAVKYPSLTTQIHLTKYAWFFEIIKKWNVHMQEKLVSKTILYLGKTKSDLENAVKRGDPKVMNNLRVLNSIYEHPDQGVFADPAAYMAFLHFNDWVPSYMTVGLKEKLSYTTVNQSKLYYFKFLDSALLATQFDTIVSRNMDKLEIRKI